MTPNEFTARLHSGSLNGLYLFEGPEEYIKSETLASVRQILLVPGFELMNENVMESVPVQEVSDIADTLPFMCEKRLVIVKDPAFLNVNDGDPSLSVLNRMLNSPSETSVVLLYARGEVNEKKKAVKSIAEAGRLVSFELLSESELSAWIIKQFKNSGHTADKEIARELIYMVGRQMGSLDTEIRKLSDYAGNRKQITSDDINEIVTPDMEFTIFNIVDFLIDKKMDEACNVLKKLMDSGERETHILSVIIRQMRLLAHVAVLSDAGMSVSEMANRLGEKSTYPISKTATLCRGISTKRLINIYKKGVDAEFRIKRGQAEAMPVLEQVMYLLYSVKNQT